MEGYSRCSAAHGNFVAIGVGKSVLVYRISDLVMGRDIKKKKMPYHREHGVSRRCEVSGHQPLRRVCGCGARGWAAGDTISEGRGI